ncbi:hypothetical protein T06_8307 [Trichinella sp. T6]|nr:hypothetical protein T06_8307 [Trichinella sp. T6]
MAYIIDVEGEFLTGMVSLLHLYPIRADFRKWAFENWCDFFNSKLAIDTVDLLAFLSTCCLLIVRLWCIRRHGRPPVGKEENFSLLHFCVKLSNPNGLLVSNLCRRCPLKSSSSR